MLRIVFSMLLGTAWLGGCVLSGPGKPATVTVQAPTPATEQSAALPEPTGQACPRCSPATEQGTLSSEQMREVSGLAASRIHPGVLYAHNDSGDGPRLFAISTQGVLLGTFSVHGAEAIDWEEIAPGPCGDGRPGCLYIADTGNNLHLRKHFTLYRVKEPVAPGRDGTLSAEAFSFTFPSGRSSNTEALVVHPRTGVITFLSQEGHGASAIYEMPLPLDANRSVRLIDRGPYQLPQGSLLITAAQIAPQGLGLIIRTYTHLFYYPLGPGQSVTDALIAPGCVLPVANEPQGEAVAFASTGDGYFTVSEGVHAVISRVQCSGPWR